MPLFVHYWADLQSVHGLHCYGNITRTVVKLAFVSDIAVVFVLKSDGKLQPTNKLASTLQYDNIVRTRNVSYA